MDIYKTLYIKSISLYPSSSQRLARRGEDCFSFFYTSPFFVKSSFTKPTIFFTASSIRFWVYAI